MPQSPCVEAHRLTDDGTFPNNASRPLLVYRSAFDLRAHAEPASLVERTFAAHDWTKSWRNGVYDFDHYHATTHEVLGCYSGSARVRFGGPTGVELELRAGDVVVIPAGVAHKRIAADADFRVVGAYASGREYDMNRGAPEERPRADQNIAQVPLPALDPVFGAEGPLRIHWTQSPP